MECSEFVFKLNLKAILFFTLQKHITLGFQQGEKQSKRVINLLLWPLLHLHILPYWYWRVKSGLFASPWTFCFFLRGALWIVMVSKVTKIVKRHGSSYGAQAKSWAVLSLEWSNQSLESNQVLSWWNASFCLRSMTADTDHKYKNFSGIILKRRAAITRSHKKINIMWSYISATYRKSKAIISLSSWTSKVQSCLGTTKQILKNICKKNYILYRSRFPAVGW